MAAAYAPDNPAQLLAGIAVAFVAPVFITLSFIYWPGVHVPAVRIWYLLTTITVSVLVGWIPALLSTVASVLLVDAFVSPPLTLTDPADIGLLIASLFAIALLTAAAHRYRPPTAPGERDVTDTVDTAFATCGAGTWAAVYAPPDQTRYVHAIWAPHQTPEETAQLLADGVHGVTQVDG